MEVLGCWATLCSTPRGILQKELHVRIANAEKADYLGSMAECFECGMRNANSRRSAAFRLSLMRATDVFPSTAGLVGAKDGFPVGSPAPHFLHAPGVSSLRGRLAPAAQGTTEVAFSSGCGGRGHGSGAGGASWRTSAGR